jgi:hypothetical protein
MVSMTAVAADVFSVFNPGAVDGAFVEVSLTSATPLPTTTTN